MAFADRLEVDGAIAVDGGHGSLKPFALAAMRLAFLEGANLADAEAVLEAGRRTGIDANELQQALDDPVVKDALRSTTAEALALGVFGVPTIAVEGQLFWGDDRLRDAVAACGSPRGGRSADQLGGRSPAGERSISS
jgi:2-hydroxychromene-2-carboxylate isomerase